MKQIETKLKKVVKKLFAQGRVEYFIGYEVEGGRVIPSIITKEEEVGRLVWNEFCSRNLSKYLLKLKSKKTGIVVKGCDARGVVELIKYNQIKREEVIIVGVECNGQKREEEGVHPKCFHCVHPQDFKYDEIIGKMVPFKRNESGENIPIENLSRKERYAFWDNEFSKCIHCRACREVCYACFCSECVFETPTPFWGESITKKELAWLFHLTRAIHIAGMCIECLNCEDVCPMGIKVSWLNKKINSILKELFNYKGGGTEMRSKNPLLSIKPYEKVEKE